MRKFRVLVNGSEYEVDIEEINEASKIPASLGPTAPATGSTVTPISRPASASTPSPPSRVPSVGTVIAQMPGTIVDILVNPNDKVTRGQHLLILEAMKMANEVVAPQDGIVIEVRVIKGASVNTGDILIVLG